MFTPLQQLCWCSFVVLDLEKEYMTGAGRRIELLTPTLLEALSRLRDTNATSPENVIPVYLQFLQQTESRTEETRVQILDREGHDSEAAHYVRKNKHAYKEEVRALEVRETFMDAVSFLAKGPAEIAANLRSTEDHIRILNETLINYGGDKHTEILDATQWQMHQAAIAHEAYSEFLQASLHHSLASLHSVLQYIVWRNQYIPQKSVAYIFTRNSDDISWGQPPALLESDIWDDVLKLSGFSLYPERPFNSALRRIGMSIPAVILWMLPACLRPRILVVTSDLEEQLRGLQDVQEILKKYSQSRSSST